MNKSVDKYIKELQMFLPVMGKYEKKFIKNIRQNMIEYMENHPDAGYSDICDRFGTPRDMVIDYFEIIDTEYLLKKTRLSSIIRKSIFCIVLCIAIVCAIELGLYYKAYLSVQDGINGYYVETIE